MRKTRLVHAAASIGKVIFSVLQVLSVIGAVCLLSATLSLSFLPAGTMEVDTTANVSINFRLNRLVEGDFTEYRDLLMSGFEGAEKTEDGFKVEEISSAPLENRKMALALIPNFAQTVVLFFFCRNAKKLCRDLKESPLSPFTPDAPEYFKSLGISIFALALAPWITASLIQMITGVATNISLEMGTVLWGLFALALADVFRIGATLTPPPFTNTGFTPPPPQPENRDDSNHPDAF